MTAFQRAYADQRTARASLDRVYALGYRYARRFRVDPHQIDRLETRLLAALDTRDRADATLAALWDALSRSLHPIPIITDADGYARGTDIDAAADLLAAFLARGVVADPDALIDRTDDSIDARILIDLALLRRLRL